MRLMIHRWLQAVPYTDAHLHRQATMIQLLLITLAGATSIALPVALLMPEATLPRGIIAGALLTYLVSVGAALALVRRGAFISATRLMIAGLTLILLIALIGYRFGQSRSVLLGIAVPMVLAALLTDRRTLLGVTALIVVGMIGAVFLDAPQSLRIDPAFFRTALVNNGLLATLLVIGVIYVCLDQFGLHLRRNIEEQRTINGQLQKAAAIAARNEQSLRRSEARFNAFINQSPAAS